MPISAIGLADITFREDQQQVADNLQVSVSWMAEDKVTCLNCEWTGVAKAAQVQGEEELIQRVLYYLSNLPRLEGDHDAEERLFLIRKLRGWAKKLSKAR
jgi:hypothetical protein